MRDDEEELEDPDSLEELPEQEIHDVDDEPDVSLSLQTWLAPDGSFTTAHDATLSFLRDTLLLFLL